MSEESKVDTDYIQMSSDVAPGVSSGNTLNVPGLDDPNLSQEDRDLRLAIALQQQENAAAYDDHKKRHDAAVKANVNRTSRSNVHSRLATVRAKDHGMLTVPDEYTTENAYKKGDSNYVNPDANGGVNMDNLKGALPQEVADLKLAMDLQKMEQTGAGTARTMNKILTEEKEDEQANELRNARSGKAAFHPTRAKKN
mmetsp:Transcript_24068/g.49213  ORF Transcript_24068/g.49213 Transcript_24068/m.49213 type:complete len:197 (+) Transcript_24068:192-782(+)